MRKGLFTNEDIINEGPKKKATRTLFLTFLENHPYLFPLIKYWDYKRVL